MVAGQLTKAPRYAGNSSRHDVCPDPTASAISDDESQVQKASPSAHSNCRWLEKRVSTGSCCKLSKSKGGAQLLYLTTAQAAAAGGLKNPNCAVQVAVRHQLMSTRRACPSRGLYFDLDKRPDRERMPELESLLACTCTTIYPIW